MKRIISINWLQNSKFNCIYKENFFLILLESFSVAISFAEERTNKQTRNDIFSIILHLAETSNRNFGNEMVKSMVELIAFIVQHAKMLSVGNVLWFATIQI